MSYVALETKTLQGPKHVTFTRITGVGSGGGGGGKGEQWYVCAPPTFNPKFFISTWIICLYNTDK